MNLGMLHQNSFDMVVQLLPTHLSWAFTILKLLSPAPSLLGDSGRLERSNSTTGTSCQSLSVRFSSFEFSLGSFSYTWF